MSVSLEKSPHIPEQGGSSENQGTDYAAMYKEAHPGAVEDVNKAESIAHATDRLESNRVIQGQEAINQAMADRPDHEIQNSLSAAQYSREKADLVAKKVADVYDRVQDLKS